MTTSTADVPASHLVKAEDPPLIPLLFRLHHIMMRVGDRLTKEHGLSSSRWMLLCVLGNAEQPLTVGEVSEDLLLSPQNISRMAAVLEKEGLVERSSRPGAGRSTYLELTPRGVAARSLLRELGEPMVERMLEGVPDARQRSMEDDLQKLIENVVGYERELIDIESKPDTEDAR
ncbi:MAG: MarR family transcriptional regulator [Planctomycetota bacterium]